MISSVTAIYIETLALFGGCLVLQIILWRLLRRPNDVVPYQILLLFALFWGVPLLYTLKFPSLDQLILSLALGSCYIMSFPAAAAKSPTVIILHLLHKHRGMTRSELEKALTAELDLKGDRMRDLKADGLYSDQGRPSLVGRLLGRAFLTYRRVLGIPLGGG